MPYVINWNSSEPIGSTLPAGQLDDEIRKTKVGTEERMAHIIGNNNWATNVFPVIDGVNIKSLAALTAGLASAGNINPSFNTIARRGAGTTLVDSIGDDGTTIDFGTRTFRMRGINYSWPTSAVVGNFLQLSSSGGNLVWAAPGSGGTVAGTGTVNRVPLWTAASTLADSMISQAVNGVVTVNNSLVVSGPVNAVNFVATGGFSGASITITGALNAQSVSVSSTVSVPTVVVNGFIAVSAASGAKRVLTLQDAGTASNPIAIDLSFAGGEYRNGGLKVVGNRIAGWGTPTGTATRSTFASDTVTLVELGRRMKALIDDLTTHGLIGP